MVLICKNVEKICVDHLNINSRTVSSLYVVAGGLYLLAGGLHLQEKVLRGLKGSKWLKKAFNLSLAAFF